MKGAPPLLPKIYAPKLKPLFQSLVREARLVFQIQKVHDGPVRTKGVKPQFSVTTKHQ